MKIYPTLVALLLLQQVFASIWSWERDPHEVGNAINQQCLGIDAEKFEVFSVINREITCAQRTTPVRIYTPAGHANKSLPIILFIHGGAWVGGNLDTHDNLARYLCKSAQAWVISVGYLNAPEGKFPLPLEQCYDALLWIKDQASTFGADVSQLAVVGDSAGGNMAAALCLMSRDRNGPAIALQVLINPAPDLTGHGTLHRQDNAWDVMRWQALHYVEDPADVYHPYVSPSLAQDLSNLHPALMILAEKDFLFDDGKKYADLLKKAGVPTEIYVQPEIGHLGCQGARATKSAQESLDRVVEALRTNFK